MSDQDRTRDELIAEVAALHKQFTALEAAAVAGTGTAGGPDAERIFLSALMSNIPDSIYFKDKQSRFLMVNRALADRFGLEGPGEAVGKSDADFFLPEHANDALKDEQELLRTGAPLVAKEEKETMPDGTVRWVSTTKMPFYDRGGRVIGTFGVSRDVTENRLSEDALRRSEEELRRHRDNLEDLVTERTSELEQMNKQLQREVHERGRAEAALRLSEERYRQLLATTPTYVYTVNTENGETVSTGHGSGCEAITGYTPQEFEASADLWISIVHQDDRDLVLGLLARDLSSGSRSPIEHRIVHKDGTVRWVRNTIVHHYDDHGRLMHYDGLVEDITERKLGEEALREGERLRAVGSLASGVAHSFNTIMSVVNANAAAIADNVLPGTAAYGEARSIMDAIGHASELTSRLLSVAGALDTDGGAEISAVPLGQVVRDVAELVGHPYGERNIRIEVVAAEKMPHVKANAAQLIDTLMGVLANAAEAMPEGGTITVRARRKSVTKLEPRWGPKAEPGRYVTLDVEDTGLGIDEQTIEHIFEPFFTTKESATSFGLGLTVVQNMVEGWGGWVDVSSELGSGTSIRMFIPRAERRARARDEKRDIVIDGQSILLVDDDVDFLAMMRHELETVGFSVHTAGTAEEAVELYRQNGGNIDVSVIDMVMPGSDGKHVLKHILRADPQAKVIVTSGFSRDYARHYLDFGAWRFLQKPVAADSLVGTLKSALARRRGL